MLNTNLQKLREKAASIFTLSSLYCREEEGCALPSLYDPPKIKVVIVLRGFCAIPSALKIRKSEKYMLTKKEHAHERDRETQNTKNKTNGEFKERNMISDVAVVQTCVSNMCQGNTQKWFYTL